MSVLLCRILCQCCGVGFYVSVVVYDFMSMLLCRILSVLWCRNFMKILSELLCRILCQCCCVGFYVSVVV